MNGHKITGEELDEVRDYLDVRVGTFSTWRRDALFVLAGVLIGLVLIWSVLSWYTSSGTTQVVERARAECLNTGGTWNVEHDDGPVRYSCDTGTVPNTGGNE